MNALIDNELKSVISRLVNARESEEGTVVTLPTIYPSGSPVLVRVTFDGQVCFVTDMGLASHEADMLGATQRQFANQARRVAEEYGVQFDNHSFFAVQVPLDRLSGAIRIIGAASQKSVVLTQDKLSEINDSATRADLLQRLTAVYGQARVESDVSLAGSSSHKWAFVGRVITEKGPVVFDAATDSPSSVFSAVAKFSDIRMLERPPKGVICVPQLAKFTTDYRNLLQQAANVIEIGSPDETFRLIAEAA
jgi:hypothetical protein